jgi:hypothetical protein
MLQIELNFFLNVHNFYIMIIKYPKDYNKIKDIQNMEEEKIFKLEHHFFELNIIRLSLNKLQAGN